MPGRVIRRCFEDSGLHPGALPISEVTIRGRADPVVVRTVVDAAMLASVLDSDAGMAGPKQPEDENYTTV